MTGSRLAIAITAVIMTTVLVAGGLAGALPGTKSVKNDDIGTGAVNSRTIKNNNIKSKDIRNNTIQSKDIRDGTITAADLAPGTDTDTVGALSCASDQVAQFDGAVWACKTAVLVRSVGPTTNTTLETTDDVGYYTSMAVGLDANPVISHQDNTNGDLELYVCADPTCSSGTNQTLEETGDVGWD